MLVSLTSNSSYSFDNQNFKKYNVEKILQYIVRGNISFAVEAIKSILDSTIEDFQPQNSQTPTAVDSSAVVIDSFELLEKIFNEFEEDENPLDKRYLSEEVKKLLSDIEEEFNIEFDTKFTTIEVNMDESMRIHIDQSVRMLNALRRKHGLSVILANRPDMEKLRDHALDQKVEEKRFYEFIKLIQGSVADVIDIEWNSMLFTNSEFSSVLKKECNDKEVKMLLSHHDYDKTPGLEEFDNIYNECNDSELCDKKMPLKFAVETKKEEDLEIIEKILENKKYHVFFAKMGSKHDRMRPIFGSESSFSYLRMSENGTAPNMMNLEEFVVINALKFLILKKEQKTPNKQLNDNYLSLFGFYDKLYQHKFKQP